MLLVYRAMKARNLLAAATLYSDFFMTIASPGHRLENSSVSRMTFGARSLSMIS